MDWLDAEHSTWQHTTDIRNRHLWPWRNIQYYYSTYYFLDCATCKLNLIEVVLLPMSCDMSECALRFLAFWYKARFSEKVFRIKGAFGFYVQILSEVLLLPERIQEYITEIYLGFHTKGLTFISDYNKLEFWSHMIKKIPKIKSHENPSVGAELFHGDEHMKGEKEARQTGKHEEFDGRSP